MPVLIVRERDQFYLQIGCRTVQKLDLPPVVDLLCDVPAMRTSLDPCSFLIVSIAGWMSRHQQSVIEYLIEENRVLREQIGRRRMRFSDDQRRRLAAKAKVLGRKLLAEVATIVTPETLLGWLRKLIAMNTTAPRVEHQDRHPRSKRLRH